MSESIIEEKPLREDVNLSPSFVESPTALQASYLIVTILFAVTKRHITFVTDLRTPDKYNTWFMKLRFPSFSKVLSFLPDGLK